MHHHPTQYDKRVWTLALTAMAVMVIGALGMVSMYLYNGGKFAVSFAILQGWGLGVLGCLRLLDAFDRH